MKNIHRDIVQFFVLVFCFSFYYATPIFGGPLNPGTIVYSPKYGIGQVEMEFPRDRATGGNIYFSEQKNRIPINSDKFKELGLEYEVPSIEYKGFKLTSGVRVHVKGGHDALIRRIFSKGTVLYRIVDGPEAGEEFLDNFLSSDEQLHLSTQLSKNNENKIRDAPHQPKNGEEAEVSSGNDDLLSTEARSIAVDSGRPYKQFLGSDFTSIEDLADTIETVVTDKQPNVIIDLVFESRRDSLLIDLEQTKMSDHLLLGPGKTEAKIYLSDKSYSSAEGRSRPLTKLSLCDHLIENLDLVHLN